MMCFRLTFGLLPEDVRNRDLISRFAIGVRERNRILRSVVRPVFTARQLSSRIATLLDDGDPNRLCNGVTFQTVARQAPENVLEDGVNRIAVVLATNTRITTALAIVCTIGREFAQVLGHHDIA